MKRRILSLLLMVCLACGLLSTAALATEVENVPVPAETEETGKETTPEETPTPTEPLEGSETPEGTEMPEPAGTPAPSPSPEETPGQETEAEAPAPEPVETPEPAESSEPEPELTAEETVGGTCGENLTWELNLTTGVLTISGTGEMAHAWSDSSCPWKSYRSSITSVIIEDGVTSIGTLMFHACHALTSVSIPNSVTIIETSAFNSCSALTRVAIPGSVVSIESSAFESCYDLASVTIEYGVTSIDYWAFQNCKSLTSLVIPGSVTSIGHEAFKNCSSLTSVSLPDSLTSIGYSAFFQCDSLTSVTVPPNITDMGMSVFNSCDKLSDVTIEDGATVIGELMFANCGSLTNITIPGSVTVIGSNAFYRCFSLADVTIEYGVTTIGRSAFEFCSSLTSITIPDSVTVIGSGAFSYCSDLISIALPNGMSTINVSTFYNCSGLTSVTIPISVTAIQDNAFYGCPGLTDVYYSGSPDTWAGISVAENNEYLESAQIHYGSDSALNTSSDVNGVNPEVSSLHIVGFSGRELVMDGVQDKVIAVFNKNIAKGSTSRGIAIWDLDTKRMVQLLPVESENVRASANCLTIDVGALDLPSGRTYSVTVPPGVVESADGDVFYGLEDKTSWVFTIPRDLLLDAEGRVTMEWADSSWLPFHHVNDYTKPPVPAGTDGEYAALLSDWAWSCGYELPEAEALELLDEPVYLPVTSLSGDPFLLNDNATTVRQVVEDILFTTNLQPYLNELDALLAQVENSTGADTAWGQIAGILSTETATYELAAGWYDQVNRHMTGRTEDSNFFLSLGAPIAYQLLMDKMASGQTGPVVKAQLALVENEAALSTIGGMETYTQFKDAVKDVGTAGQGLSAAYTAYVDGNPKNLVRFGYNLLEEHWSGVGSEMLEEITGAYQEISSAKSAVQLCMFLGSSIGYFPMVVDLYQNLNNSRYNQIKTAYFLADYYVAEKDPALYKVILGLDDGMLHSPSYVWNHFPSEALDYDTALMRGEVSTDPVIANWARFISTGGMVELDEQDIAMLRRDITNYAAILRYAKSVDAEEAITALVAYLEAEAEQESRTAIAVSCPVKVNLYDENNQLVAFLSSNEEGIITDNRYGTLYLLGENGETKYFYLNSADYRVEIVPYDAGTMDVTITQTEGDGTASSVYYEGVALETGMTFSTSSAVSADAVLTETTTSTAILPEDEIPVTFLRLEGPREVAVGGSDRLTVTASPVTTTDKTVSWESSDPSVLEVSQDGTLTALSVGRATVTAAAESGISASTEVSVYVPAASLTAGEHTRSLLVGESCRLDMAVTGEPTHAVTWSSGNAGVVSVEADGTVHALSAGSSVVTAEIDGLRQDVTVTVYEQPIQVTLYQSDVSGMRVKADVTNVSAGQSFAGNVFLALYDGSRMVGISRITAGLAAGETVTCYYPLGNLNPGATYSASIFVLDGTGAPQRVKASMDLLT